MTLNLTRIDYTTVGATSRGTTRLLPAADSQQTQKFAVADHDGVLHIYGMKKGELQLTFKSLPGPKVSRIVLGGIIGTQKDKIFVAIGSSVKGYTRKGKLFLEFDTSLLDPISSFYVLGPDLAACARDLYHRYRDCRDADAFLVGEKITDVVLLPSEGTSVVAVLACGDSAVRVLQGGKSPTVLRLGTVPTVLTVYREGDEESNDRVLMGTVDGRVGLLALQTDKTLRVTWFLTEPGFEITSLDTYALEDDPDIIVGRQNGLVEVYAYPKEHEVSHMLRYRYNCGESISSVLGGVVGTVGYAEILVTTYSGRVFALTTKPPGLLEAGQDDVYAAKLKAEIEQLEQKFNHHERDTFGIFSDALAPPILTLDHRMLLDKEDASYILSVELETSIDNVLVQSNTPIDLLDVESNSAVASLSACDPRAGNYVLATYRCQVNTNRLDMKFRTIEGQSGKLQVYVTSQVQPKCCRRVELAICALSLHARIHKDDDNVPVGGPFNELRLKGAFSTAEIHAWLALALPNLPERPQLEDGEGHLTYRSTFVGTILKITYRKGQAMFLGENVSSIVILRDILTSEATKRKIKLDVFFNVVERSIARVLEIVLPKIEKAQELKERIKTVDALLEWELNGNPENLCAKYQELLQNESEMRTQLESDPEFLARLYGAVTDLYVDWERARGNQKITSKAASDKLKLALEARDDALLMQIFCGSNNSSRQNVTHFTDDAGLFDA